MPLPTAIKPGPANQGDILPSGLETSLAEVRNALEYLKYGHISVTVHDGKVVQIDVTEKKRFS